MVYAEEGSSHPGLEWHRCAAPGELGEAGATNAVIPCRSGRPTPYPPWAYEEGNPLRQEGPEEDFIWGAGDVYLWVHPSLAPPAREDGGYTQQVEDDTNG